MTLKELNSMIDLALKDYYYYREADHFFKIDALLNYCKKNNLTVEKVPRLIEMQNVIVLG